MRQIPDFAVSFRRTQPCGRSGFARPYQPLCRQRGRQHHRSVHHRQRRQALCAEHREYAGHLPSGCIGRPATTSMWSTLTSPCRLARPASPCSGSIAVFPILTADRPRPQALAARQHAWTPSVNTSISASYWPLSAARQSAPTSSCPPRSPQRIGRLCLRHRAMIPQRTSDTSSDLLRNADGTLTAFCWLPTGRGTHPCAMVSDASGTYLYVTDSRAERRLRFQSQWRELGAFERQPICHRWPANRDRD